MAPDASILSTLNPPQIEAVTAADGPVLILAGAGSGKTRVLVHRIAWLIQQRQVAPHQILAVTFTNKAAREMKTRIEALLPFNLQGMWVGTFHGLANRLLRTHHQQAGLPAAFQILDSADQLQLLKRLVVDLGLDPKEWAPKQFQWMLNEAKEQGHRARHVDPEVDYLQRQFVRVYVAYEAACERAGMVDFAELLLKAHELLLENPELLAHYQARFQHILVDEFQDTNKIQYAWLRLLAAKHQGLFAVGDDDQSIYGWRGAEVENIRSFDRTYTEAMVVRLEQNYRSSGHILGLANHLIEHNQDRLGKALWTDTGDGELVTLYAAYNEVDEARYVLEQIQLHYARGVCYQDMAILYRSNAQSRLFEEQLLQANIHYRVYGGLRFFDRKEVKDALAYLRLLSNPNDDAAFERVVNRPTRGIGAKCLNAVKSLANETQKTLWAAAKVLIGGTVLAARSRQALSKFLHLIETLQQEGQALPLPACVEYVITQSELQRAYDKEPPDTAASRRENLAELVNAAAQVDADEGDAMNVFLSFTALEAGDEDDAPKDSVQLMSLHSAKGLEFPLVFITGMEEGLFPNNRAFDDLAKLEEERRLCYVGVTRAMATLYLTYAHARRLYGEVKYPQPSRFIEEMPSQHLQQMTDEQIRPAVYEDDIMLPFELGQRVAHATFGEGVVLAFDAHGQQMKAHINFSSVGLKWLNLEYAKLVALS